jgi:membrane protein
MAATANTRSANETLGRQKSHPPIPIRKLLADSMRGFIQDNGMRLSAALAYYAAFSLAPLLLIILSIAGAVFGDEAVRGMIFTELHRDLGASGALMVEDMVAHAHRPGKSLLMSLVGLVILLFGAAGFFGELKASLNAIWNIPEKGGSSIWAMVKARFLSFSMVLGTGFLLLVSMIFSAILQFIGQRVGEIASIPAPVWAAIGGISSFILIGLLFAAIFKVLPDTWIPWRAVWVGAIFTSGLFATGKSILAWYIGREAIESSYGSAGAFIAILLWLYYSSAILLFGAEFTQHHAAAMPSSRRPSSRS